jgi:hypothetical protein
MDKAETHQHYVPQFILRGFASGRSKQLHVFDKANSKSFKTAVRNVASEGGSYDAEIGGVTHSLDPFLSKLEEHAKDPIRKVLTTRSVRGLSVEERASIAVFVTIQLLRTNAHRRQFKHMNDMFRDAIIQRGGDPYNVENFKVLDEEAARVAHLRLIPGLARDLAPHFVDKSWLLYSTLQKHAFYISDNPVTMYNTVNQDPNRGTAGIAVPGIEIYLPLSGTLCLGFLCPTLEEWIRDGQMHADRLGVPLSLHDFITALDGNGTLGLAPESVMHQNSLQVINAEQYIFSSNGDFSLVLDMLLISS